MALDDEIGDFHSQALLPEAHSWKDVGFSDKGFEDKTKWLVTNPENPKRIKYKNRAEEIERLYTDKIVIEMLGPDDLAKLIKGEN